MAQYIDEFQRFVAQLERMGSNAISEECKVSLCLFSMERNSLLENTIAALCTNGTKNWTWTDLSPALIVEKKYICTKKGFSQTARIFFHSTNLKTKNDEIAKAASTKKHSQFFNIVCKFCGKRVVQPQSALQIQTQPTAVFLINQKSSPSLNLHR